MSSSSAFSGTVKRSLRVILIGILAAAFGLALAPLGVAATASADDPTGTVTGTITDSSGITPIFNLYVGLMNLPTGTPNDGGRVGYTFSGVDGTYTITDVPPGTYDLEVVDSHNDPTYLDSETDNVTVTANATTTENVSMTTGGVVTGQVVDGNDVPIGGIVVTSDTENSGTTVTDDSGDFTLTGLSYGPHEIYINTEEDNHDIGHGGDSYNVDNSFGPAHVKVGLVTLDGGPVAIPTVTLDAPSTISGVLLGSTGAPVGNVQVSAETVDPDGTVSDLTTNLDQAVFTTSTGAFDLTNLPTGNIYLHFTPELGTAAGNAYDPQYLGGSSDVTLSTPIEITTEGSTIFREMRLTSNGAVTGTVTNGVSHKALGHVLVDAEPLVAGSSSSVDAVKEDEEGIGGGAYTNSKGAFAIPGLPAGTYQVTYNSESSGPALASSDTSTVALYVPANTTVSHSVALTQRTRITGTVRDATHLLSGIQVDAFVYNTITQTVGPDPISDGRDTTFSTSNGSYTLYLDPGQTYVIRFTDPNGLHGVSYLGGGTSPTDAATTKLPVGSAALASKNLTMTTPGGTISATILDSDGNPASSYGTEVLNRLTDPEGTVTGDIVSVQDIGDTPFSDLPDGSYQLVITPFANWDFTIAPTTVDFTLEAGVLSEINGIPATGNDLGTIQLSAPTYVPDPQYTIGGNLPSINSTTDLNIGDVLSVNAGDWSPAPPQFFYQWYRNGRPILGATGTTHTITPGDVGKQLSVGLYFYDPNSEGGDNQPDAMTAQTDPVQAGQIAPPSVAPSISGTDRVGQTLTGSKGTWSTPLLNFSYQWIRVLGPMTTVVSTATTYKPVAADAVTGTTLVFSVTASRLGYDPATATSDPATIGLASAPKLTVSPKIVHIVATNSYTVSSGTWSPSGTTHTYQWLTQDRSDGAIADGPTTNTYASAPTGSRIQVVITAARAGYATSSVTLTAQLGDPVQVSGGTPDITGTNTYGYPLTADVSGLITVPSGATYLYQWYRAAAKIAGATKAIYTPTSADVSKPLSVWVTPVVSGYANGAVLVSDPVIEQPAGSFLGLGGVTVNGTESVGRTLTAVPGGWNPTPTTTLYQWYRISSLTLVHTKITGATKSTYLLGSADLGNFLDVHITVERVGYVAGSIDVSTSAITSLAIQNVTAPSIGTSAHVGAALTATPGTWDVASTTYTYQWWDNGVPIVGATAATFVPAESDLADDINVEVAAHRVGFGSSDPVASPVLTVDLGSAAKATAVPHLSVAGKTVTSLKRGTTVAATTGTWTTSGLVFSYQWQVNRNDGNGYVDLTTADATSNTLLLNSTGDSADFALLYSYRVVVTAEHAGYLQSTPITSGALTIKS